MNRLSRLKRALALISAIAMLAATACSSESAKQTTTALETTVEVAADSSAVFEESAKATDYTAMTAEEITASLSLEQKAAQMVQAAVYSVSKDQMTDHCYGSILSNVYAPATSAQWQEIVRSYQEAALASDAKIPYLYGNDDVHGVNYCADAVIFPHNIGLGAANDPELTYQMGLAVADEAKICNMLWTFSPCVAQSEDPRWGRTYESYGADLDIIKSLSLSFTKGLVDGGVIACAKHFFADGNVEYGTGEQSDVNRIIDRGDAELTEDEISALLDVYKQLVDAGVQTVMITHSAVNGVKMHESEKYMSYLKNDLGFDGFIVSDWNSIQNTSGATYKEQVINCVNAGIDMLMEVDTFEDARQIIVNAVNDGEISADRVNDAVTRIIRVKKNEGIFDDPLCEKLSTKQADVGSDEYRAIARKLVSESLVLLKNDNNALPLKSGTKVYVTGPAAHNSGAQCGGWTYVWNGMSDPDRGRYKNIESCTTITEGLNEIADEYGLTIITDEAEAENADIVLLAVGEQAYAEWNGDTEDLALCGMLGLDGNQKAIDAAKALGKPTVACIIAGRQVIIDEYLGDWDAAVMCYLPGSEGGGVADVLVGKSDFSGKLPSPWYRSIDQIGTEACAFEKGYGLSYGE